MAISIMACKKQNQTGAQVEESKYTCFCKTKTEAIDHCGKDSVTASLDIYATSPNEALTNCRANEMSAKDDYTITTRTCELH